MSIPRIRRQLYGTARTLGWLQAAQGGPVKVGKRAGRVGLGRLFTRIIRALIP